MNTHRPDDEASLPGEDELGALYRKLPRKEPGPALDAAVLRAAATAVRDQQPAAAALRRARPRWPIALGSAAILVLAAGLGWRMRDMPASVPAVQPDAVTVQQASTPAAAAAPAAPQVQGYAQNALPPPPAQPAPEPERMIAAKVRPAADSAMAKRAAPVEGARLQAPVTNAPGAPVAEAPLADQAAPAAAAGERRSYAAKPAQRTLEQPRAEASVAANETLQASPAVMAAPAVAPAPAPSADTARNPNDTPAQELDKIRRLLATQRRDEARQRLADFHRDHPDYPLPDDLRTQLLTP